MPDRVDVLCLPTSGPGDTTGLAALFDCGELDPRHVIAILGKTEGNGGVNDFTREFAHISYARLLAERLGVAVSAIDARVAIIMSGGTEGVLSPHVTIFARVPGAAPATEKRLAVGVAVTRDFLPEEIGRAAQIDATAHAVDVAMRDAGIDVAEDVHFVQIKCPLLTATRIAEAHARGVATVTTDAYESMGYSRGASALGVALALREADPTDAAAANLTDWSRFSNVASTSAGIELLRNVVIVMGNAAGWGGDCTIGHAVMRDAIDIDAVLAAFASVGLPVPGRPGRADARLINVFAKAEAAPDGRVRGVRHTMLDDTDISSTRHARAAVGGMLAGIAGTGMIYVSGGAEHQGPAGGGPLAVIARHTSEAVA